MLISSILFFSFSFYFSLIDYQKGSVPRFQLFVAIILMVISIFFTGGMGRSIMSIYGCILGCMLFLLVRFVSGKKLGLADVWFSSLIGVFLGPIWWYLAVTFACLLTFCFCWFWQKRKVPFIPFLSMGALFSYTILLTKG